MHYQESFWRDYPDEAYTLAKAYVANEKQVIAWGKVLGGWCPTGRSSWASASS